MVLENVPACSPVATELPGLVAASGGKCRILPAARHMFFELPGFEARLTSKMRANLHRWERRIGGAELERVTTFSHAALEEAFALEGAGWKGAAGTSIASDPKVAWLYLAAARLFARRGQLSLCFLRAQGRRVAMLLCVEDDHTLYALKSGYDLELAPMAPGHLVVWKAAQDAERRGLGEIDLLGRDDEWKRRWTSSSHEHVTLVVYRGSAGGRLQYGLREVVKPRVLPAMREAREHLLPARCQRDDLLGDHRLGRRIVDRLGRGLGLRSGVRRVLQRRPPRAHLGEASQFAPGTWVRVLGADALRRTLDAGSRTRGLRFVPAQWEACGSVHPVLKVTRRLRDDNGRLRPVSRTVALEGVDCTGHRDPAGCGRHCPLLFRDEWLAPANRPNVAAGQAGAAADTVLGYARIRTAQEIRATLDPRGRHQGVLFMPEMAQYAGRRLAMATRLDQVYELDRWVPTRCPIYLLDGLHCNGTIYGERGPCDRACALLWHPDWLRLELAATAPTEPAD
jgi:hypothetical protein